MGRRKERTRCSGTLTDAGLKGRIISFLRKASMYWKPKNECIKNAQKGYIINPKTGRQNIAVECAECGESFPKGDIRVDHVDPVVPLGGWGDKTEFLGVNWNELIERMFVELEGYQCLCEEDHKKLTDAENKARRENKQQKEE